MIDPVEEDLNRHEAEEAQQASDEERLNDDAELGEIQDILKDAIDGELGEAILEAYNLVNFNKPEGNPLRNADEILYMVPTDKRGEAGNLLKAMLLYADRLEGQAELGRRIAKEIDEARLREFIKNSD